MSHHGSSNPDPDNNPLAKDAEMRAAMRKITEATLGEFPDGKMNDADEGALAMAITTENGVIKLAFAKPVAWVGLTPLQAAQLGMDLIKQARRAGNMPFVITL